MAPDRGSDWALRLGFGTTAGYCGTGVTLYVNTRGGQITPLVVPWARLAVGFGIATLVGQMEVLSLLRSGRSAS